MNRQITNLRHSRKVSSIIGTQKHPLQYQLEAAHLQITVLKEQNTLLNAKIQQLEHQNLFYRQHQQTIKLLHEELTFRQEQQLSMNSIILNYEHINSQLTEKVHTLRQQIYQKHVPSTAEVTLLEEESFQSEPPSTNRFRHSLLSRKSESTDRKDNHALTPKSQVKFSLNQLFDQDLPIKKRVFF